MRRNRKHETRPERAVRSRVHGLGLRYRTSLTLVLGDLRVRPDLVFTRRKLAVFVDGCYWHACPEHGVQPRVNTEYWGPKLARNVARDGRVNAVLEAAGWTVVRVWEHVPPDEAATLVAGLTRASQATPVEQDGVDGTPVLS
ncbi:MAG: very short patch repair endonuclease [Chloroflexi bacterium]|nr:very short patch repair endonuclease [Chloroflexota bacterium]